MTQPPIPQAEDGYYHPADEADVIALVQYAAANNLQIRVRGATHSVGWSIFTDPVNNVPENKTLEVAPPAGPNLNLAMDRMIALTWTDPDNGIVEVEAGCHLGPDPNDPFGTSTLENSFLYQTFQKGWAVNSLGGITHQTVSGFSATGSAGGSTKHAFDNMIAYRVVDGLGNASWIEATDDAFGAMLTNVGLLGIVTAIRFQLVPMYNIRGFEITTPVSGPQCPVDVFGPGQPGQPSLQDYLESEDYTRITWWPQQGVERFQLWKAVRVPASDEGLVPYTEFPDTFLGWTEEFFASIIFVLLGNTNQAQIFTLLKGKVARYWLLLGRMNDRHNAGTGTRIAVLLGGIIAGALGLLIGMAMANIPGSAKKLFPRIMPQMQPMEPVAGPGFFDWYWRSLCMDNQADDVLLPTEFTEIWIPIQYANQAVNLFKAQFQARGYDATGWFEMEIYPGPPSGGWINPGYTTGNDEYANGTIRFDIYWFRANDTMPNTSEGFFEQFWEMLRSHNVPFRLHWGKYVPASNLESWATYYAANLPRFQDFMNLRAQRDPKNVFYTQYWQTRLTGQAIN